MQCGLNFKYIKQTMAAFLKIDDQRKGTTFRGVEFQVLDDLGAPENITGAIIRCQFRAKDKTGRLQVDLSLGDGLTITNGSIGLFRIDQIDILDWPVDTYYFDIPILYPSGVTDNDAEGTMLVEQNTTFD